MGVLRLVATGLNDKKKSWRDDIGTAANNEVAEASLESMAKNYEKGTKLQLWEKKEKKWVNHVEVAGTGAENKNKTHENCALWAKVESDQVNIREAAGSDVDTVQFRVATYKSLLDANAALSGVASVTPKNTTLSLWVMDDNQHWKTVKVVQGKSKTSWGGTSADDQKDTKKGDKAEVEAA